MQITMTTVFSHDSATLTLRSRESQGLGVRLVALLPTPETSNAPRLRHDTACVRTAELLEVTAPAEAHARLPHKAKVPFIAGMERRRITRF